MGALPPSRPSQLCALRHAQCPPDGVRTLLSPPSCRRHPPGPWDSQGGTGMGRSTPPCPCISCWLPGSSRRTREPKAAAGQGHEKSRARGVSGQTGMPVEGGLTSCLTKPEAQRETGRQSWGRDGGRCQGLGSSASSAPSWPSE